MFDASIGQIAFLLGALGLFVGAVALIVAVEVARRSQEYLRKHAQEMSLTLSKRIGEQDRHLGEALERHRQQLREIEIKNEQSAERLNQACQRVYTQLAAQEGVVLERLRGGEQRFAALEKRVDEQRKHLNTMRGMINSLIGDVERSLSVANRREDPSPKAQEVTGEPLL